MTVGRLPFALLYRVHLADRSKAGVRLQFFWNRNASVRLLVVFQDRSHDAWERPQAIAHFVAEKGTEQRAGRDPDQSAKIVMGSMPAAAPFSKTRSRLDTPFLPLKKQRAVTC